MALSCYTQFLVFSRFSNCCCCRLGKSYSIQLSKGYCSSSSSSNILNTTNLHPIPSSPSLETPQTLAQTTLLNYTQRQQQQHTQSLAIDSSSNARVMLIDGTSVIYRAYYKLLGIYFSFILSMSYTLLPNYFFPQLFLLILPSFVSAAKLHHGHLSHADGNGDWVLTIFTALSLVSATLCCRITILMF